MFVAREQSPHQGGHFAAGEGHNILFGRGCREFGVRRSMADRRDQCVTQRDTPVLGLGNVVVSRPWPEVCIVVAATKVAFNRLLSRFLHEFFHSIPACRAMADDHLAQEFWFCGKDRPGS